VARRWGAPRWSSHGLDPARSRYARGGGPGVAAPAETRDAPSDKKGPTLRTLGALPLLQLFKQMRCACRKRSRLLGLQSHGSRRALMRRHASDGGPAVGELDGDLGTGARANMPGRRAWGTQEFAGGGLQRKARKAFSS
jgi:hypothetical protein